MRRSTLRLQFRVAVLGLLLGSWSAVAQPVESAADSAAPAASAASAASGPSTLSGMSAISSAATASAPARSYAIPGFEIVGFDFLLSRYNRHFSGSPDYDVSWGSIRRNLHGPWVVDNDPFKVNQFAHPYQGSLYHGAARSAGLNYWEAAAYTFAGSAWWEITGEQTPPSRNDQIASGVAGSFLGEPLFRMAHLLLKSRSSSVPYFWREVEAAAVSPAVGFNRMLYGSRFDAAFVDNDPLYYGRLRIGANHATHADPGTSTHLMRDAAEIGFSLDYGLPGKDGYSYRRPFDYFSFEAILSGANGVEKLTSRGLLWGTDYAIGKNYRGIVGLYGNYDYLAPQIFRVSTTALSLGTTGQWWVARELALEGTVLAGLGYSAANTVGGLANDRDYHYGTAPRVGLALRVTEGNRASFDVSAQKYYLGRISNRAAGRDDISRADAAFTWRIAGRHAIGIKYVWSHRNASYPVVGDRSQTVGSVGIYYTMLGADGFGTADWRVPAPD